MISEVRDTKAPVLIFAGIKTHALTIVGTTLATNPHYMRFDEYQASRSSAGAGEEQGRALRGVTIGPLGQVRRRRGT